MFDLFKVKSEIQFIFVSLVLAQRVTFKIHQSVVPRSAGDRKISAEVLAKLLRVGSTRDSGLALLKVRFKIFTMVTVTPSL